MSTSTLVILLGVTAVGAVLALVAVVFRKGRTEDRARAYLAGFTYVLSDDPDRAIAELSRAAQLSRETLETYFALGALFRRKGDLERAIRLHQNILLRHGLSDEVKHRAELALALDYRRSGLGEKAIECFERILYAAPENAEALLRYRQLLEGAGEWERAAQLQERLGVKAPEDASVLAHLLANQARSLKDDAPEQAEAVARRAVAVKEDSADAQLALGQVLAARGRTDEAAAAFERALAREPELAPRILPVLETVLTPEALHRLLTKQSARSAPSLLALALWRRDLGDVDGAIAQLRQLVERRPWFWEARRELGTLLLAHDRSAELRADYQEILGRLGDPAVGFVCRTCRHSQPELRFRCPACESWDTLSREEPPASAPDPLEGRGASELLRRVI